MVLKIFKSNSSSAGEVSGNCKAAFKELEQKYDGLHVVVLSNQGNYISIIVSSIPVSYTHLDVYKRQQVGGGDGALVLVQIGGRQSIAQGVCHLHIGLILGAGPVSYTHPEGC